MVHIYYVVANVAARRIDGERNELRAAAPWTKICQIGLDATSFTKCHFIEGRQWCRQDFQLTGLKYCFCPQNLKTQWNIEITFVCFSKIDGFENPPRKIDGFGRTRRTPSDDSSEKK